MTYQEIKKIAERNKPENICKRCVWGRVIADDTKSGIVNVMCLFPECIKKRAKNGTKKDNNISR